MSTICLSFFAAVAATTTSSLWSPPANVDPRVLASPCECIFVQAQTERHFGTAQRLRQLRIPCLANLEQSFYLE